MANSDKNIVITPNIGQTAQPSIVFTGQDAQDITLSVLDSAGLSISGASGQLFSVIDDATGTIFSVNDVSGIPSLEVDDDGTIRLAEFAGNVLIGTATDNGTDLLQVDGSISASSMSATTFTGALSGNATTASTLQTARTISLGGVLSGSASFNGGSNITITAAHTSDPTITLTGAVTGSGTMTNLGNVSIATTATADPTLTLAGDASGSATFTNLGNATLTVTVANDSHTHDTRYFTETESDARFLRRDLAGGSLDVNAANGTQLYIGSTGGWTNRGPATDNSGALWSINTHPGNYYSQFWFNTGGGAVYHRTSSNALPTGTWQRLFMDNYHPNADKWTTARTLSLTGAVTGSVSIDGSGNVSLATTATSDPTLTLAGDASGSATFTNLGNATLTVTIADDSHNHIISNVDGLQTALDAKLASSSYTASDVLTKIKTVDGSGSGLDADTVDGIQASSFVRKDNVDNGTVTIRIDDADFVVSDSTDTTTNFIWRDHSASKLYLGSSAAVPTTREDMVTFSGDSYWHAGNDGSGSGLDADTLDGLNSGSFFRADTSNSVDVRLAAGHGRGLRFWDSDSYKIWMSSATDATWGGRLDSTSDYNMYFRMTGGTNRGFVFQNSSTEVFQIESNGQTRQTGPAYVDTSQRVFADNYHPNADTLTTARTISLGGDVSGSASFDGSANITITAAVANDSHTHSFNNLTGKTSGTGEYSTNGALVAGRGSGSVAMTVNDGYGNANLTFNHKSGVPDTTGNAGRIVVNVDATSGADMNFGLRSGVTSGTAIGVTTILRLTETVTTSYTDFTSTGDINSTSDVRVKDNIEVIENAVDKIKQIRGVTFTRTDKEDTERRYAGVIAQEIQAVLPEVVGGDEDNLTVAYGNMVGLLIEGIKEQDNIINTMRTEIDELKALVHKLIGDK